MIAVWFLVACLGIVALIFAASMQDAVSRRREYKASSAAQEALAAMVKSRADEYEKRFQPAPKKGRP